ncbi:MAG: peptidoglycan bridge formation glycyltransferase FemA/FemB family protein [Anaerolineales bacterium]|nr:peptidoglycan bridge formation glycyltransferase FemA/FemB family protein [Anaerolineales bacterium]
MTLSTLTDARAWDALAQSLPGAHILQSWSWGEIKSRWGWQAERLAWPNGRAAAQVLTRTAARGLVRYLYVPRGPLLDWGDTALRDQVLTDLEDLARRRGAIALKLDPDVALKLGLFGAEVEQPTGQSTRAALTARGWVVSPEQVQFRNTVRLDLTRGAEAVLADMKQKMRYNVRLAARKGVTVRVGGLDDLSTLAALYAETAARDGFLIRPPAYYADVWRTLLADGHARPLMAAVEGEVVAAIVLFHYGPTAWYFYGMSRAAHRDRMPNHLLQWEAIRWAADHGLTTYDLWGAPDTFEEADRMWGVWRFKEGFNGAVQHGIGAWDFAPSPWRYRVFTSALPRIRAWLRRGTPSARLEPG